MARDIFHDTVKKALEQDGWIITHDPYRLRYGIVDIYIDLAAEEAIAFFVNHTSIQQRHFSNHLQSQSRGNRTMDKVNDKVNKSIC
jgi:Holliday junction resolvase-like predicted endonuclease